MSAGTRWDQIKTSDRQGDGTKGQAFGGGTTTTGDIAVYDAGGNVIDGGTSLATIIAGTGIWVKEVPAGALNSANVTFTLSFTPIAGSLTLFLNIVQCEGTDFTIATNTITFTVAPKARDAGWFQARYQH